MITNSLAPKMAAPRSPVSARIHPRYVEAVFLLIYSTTCATEYFGGINASMDI